MSDEKVELWMRDSHKAEIINAFHRLWYDSKVWEGRMFWDSVPIGKCPFDLFVLNEILWECQPDLVLETGTWFGGSALFMAQTLDRIGHGYVCTIDVNTEPGLPRHDRIHYIHGSSVDPEVLNEVGLRARKPRVMAVLDSNHSYTHVTAELKAYAPLVTVGQYLIVEDGTVNGHPVFPEHGPGPWEALDDWLPKHHEFEIDKAREKFLLTLNPSGFLRRVK